MAVLKLGVAPIVTFGSEIFGVAPPLGIYLAHHRAIGIDDPDRGSDRTGPRHTVLFRPLRQDRRRGPQQEQKEKSERDVKRSFEHGPPPSPIYLLAGVTRCRCEH